MEEVMEQPAQSLFNHGLCLPATGRGSLPPEVSTFAVGKCRGRHSAGLPALSRADPVPWGSWGRWSDLPLLLIDRIDNMKRIILLHFLIMLKSIPCLVQRPLLKAELIHYCTPLGFTPNVTFLL